MTIIKKTDHFTVLSTELNLTQTFYEMLGLRIGARPDFSFGGLWLYNADRPILHVVEVKTLPQERGVLDHMAFSGVDSNALLALLTDKAIGYKISQLPDPFNGWQVFFLDPNGAKVEIGFDGGDTPASKYLDAALEML